MLSFQEVQTKIHPLEWPFGFEDRDIETQTGEVTCSSPHSKLVAETR